MSHPNDLLTFPFTHKHLREFKREVLLAGSFDALMFQKEALRRDRGMKYIAPYADVEKYKRKYLTGVYQSLWPMYDTEMPYLFWRDLYDTLTRFEPNYR